MFITTKKIIIIACVSVSLLSLGTAVQPATGGVVIDRVVAVVNQDVITQSELDALGQSLEKTQLSGKINKEDLLKQAIERRLIEQKAKAKGIITSEDEVSLALQEIQTRNNLPSVDALKQGILENNISWERYLAELKFQLTGLKLMGREADGTTYVTDNEVRAYYQAHVGDYQTPDLVFLKQILIPLPKEPTYPEEVAAHQAIIQALSALTGGIGFDDLIEKYTQEGWQGGAIGPFRRGELAPEIERVIFNLTEGAISPMIRTSLGNHLFKVEKRQVARGQSFEEAQEEVKKRLLTEKREHARKQWLKTLWQEAFVEIKSRD